MNKRMMWAAVVALVTGPAQADTIYVDDDNCPGPGSGGGGIHNTASSNPAVIGCTFVANTAEGDAGLTLGAANASSPPPQPNIVLMLADDVAYNELGYTGINPFVTPNIDALAQSGIRFTHGYVTAPVCSPSRAGLLTGLYQQRYGFEHLVTKNWHGLSAGQATLTQRLQDLGYTTGVIGKWHVGFNVGVNSPLDVGVDEFFGVWGGRVCLTLPPGSSCGYWGGEVLDTSVMRRGDANVEAIWVNEGDPSEYDPVNGRYVTDAFGDEAVEFIDAHHADPNPFFLYLPFTAVHSPYDAKQEDLDQFPDLEGIQKIRAAMTLAMDRAVGEVREALVEHGIDGQTILVFTNDNGGTGLAEGEPRDNTPFRGYKNSTYEGGIRVPFVIQVPGLAGDVDYDAPVITLDLVPTLVAAAGGQVDETDGVDLMPYLTGEIADDPHEILFWRHREEWAVRRGNWKLVRPRADLELVALYDVVSDPGESVDLIMAEPQIAEELFRELTVWEAQLDKPSWHQDPDDPYNQFDHFQFRTGVPDAFWSDVEAWYEGGTTNAATMNPADAYADAILEFPADSNSYEAHNDMTRMTGQTFMLNELRFTGDFMGTMDAVGSIAGNDLLLVKSRTGVPPVIRLDAISSGTASVFAFVLGNDLEILDDLEITGDGTQDLIITGCITEYLTGRSFRKTGECSLTLGGRTTITGIFDVDNGEVVLTGPDAGITAGTVRVGAQGTLGATALCAGAPPCGTGVDCDALVFEVGPASWGTIDVGGEAVLAGSLSVVLAAPCAPPVGTTFELLTASSVTGSFDTLDLPPGLEISYEPTAIRLTVTAPVHPGDVTCDGVTDVTDLLALLAAWGPCGKPCPPSCAADLDGDCEVGVTDLLILLGNWG